MCKIANTDWNTTSFIKLDLPWRRIPRANKPIWSSSKSETTPTTPDSSGDKVWSACFPHRIRSSIFEKHQRQRQGQIKPRHRQFPAMMQPSRIAERRLRWLWRLFDNLLPGRYLARCLSQWRRWNLRWDPFAPGVGGSGVEASGFLGAIFMRLPESRILATDLWVVLLET